MPPEIRQRFFALAGGVQRARIVVIPAYEADSKQVAAMCETWQGLGAKSVSVLQATSRDEADRPDFAALLDDATGVWLSDGDQAWLSKCYVETRVESKLRECSIAVASSAAAQPEPQR